MTSTIVNKYGRSAVEASAHECSGATLFSALHALDLRLAAVIESAEKVYGTKFQVDQFRGLHLGAGEVSRLLARSPGLSPLGVGPLAELCEEWPERFLFLAATFDLDLFDLGLLLVGVAPEIDLRYERLYAYLQDDVTRKKPSVDLALNLLTSSSEGRLRARSNFQSAAPLSRHRLITLTDESGYPNSPLLAKTIQVDPRIVEYLLGSDHLPADLFDCVWLSTPRKKKEELLLDHATAQSLLQLCRSLNANSDCSVLYLDGPSAVSKVSAAEFICARLAKRLLRVDVVQLESLDDPTYAETLRRIVRETHLQDAVIFLENFDQLLVDRMNRRLLQSVYLIADAGLSILAGNTPWEPADILSGRHYYHVVLEPPGFEKRLQLWQFELNSMSAADLEKVAATFVFTADQIRAAAITAERMARWRDQQRPQITAIDLFEACRRHSNQKLSQLAQKLVPRSGWHDIVLPDDQMSQFREICNQFVHRPMVLGVWGFDTKLSYGKGLNVLFSGPPGTGKTMAAEVIAQELMLDIYRIDLSQVVSKYIGETEKNLDRIFAEAKTSNAILFFDEADALFGKRSEVKDAHDRYANIETGYLLQKMEGYEGIAILATNLRGNMDEAFVRRMSFCVEFPFPQVQERRLIWERVWPDDTPRKADLPLERLAREFEVSGGSIKNIALSAAYLAASDGGVIALGHLMQATRREYQKMGKVMIGGEFDQQRP